MRSYMAYLYASMAVAACLLLVACNTTPTLEAELSSHRKTMIQAALQKNTDLLVSLYDPQAVCMAEFQPTLSGTSSIQQYYDSLFARQTIRDYQRETTELIVLDSIILETGLFTKSFTTPRDITHYDTGKYINIWSRAPGGQLVLRAEAWGYLHPIRQPEEYVVNLPDSRPPMHLISPDSARTLLATLQILNARMGTAVRERDSATRAGFFTPDAVFMPFADTLQRGITAIRGHMAAYHNNAVVIDSISVETQYAALLPGYVLEYPTFYVNWRVEDNTGTSKGKGIRLWKYMPDGTLKIHREISVHDL